MMTILCVSDWSGIISTILASSAGLLGVYISFKQWKNEKQKQRETEGKELLTKVVGSCMGNLDYIVLQYRKFNMRYIQGNADLQKEWIQLQEIVEPLVKESEEICNEAELKIYDENVLNSLKAVEDAYIMLITECTKEEAEISTRLDEYHHKRKIFMQIAKEYLQSLKK